MPPDTLLTPEACVVFRETVLFSITFYYLAQGRSAAENFAMMMDVFPNVTLVGTRTLGTLSGMLGKSINEFYTTYSNQRLVNSEGIYFEVTGVIPDIELQVFSEDDVMNGHLNAVRKIVKIIEEKKRNR